MGYQPANGDWDLIDLLVIFTFALGILTIAAGWHSTFKFLASINLEHHPNSTFVEGHVEGKRAELLADDNCSCEVVVDD